jgi:3-oxoacyl-[acyl-carrier-protein] synthase II
MKPLAVAAWSMVTPFGEGDAAIEALFANRAAFSPVPTDAALRSELAALVPGWPDRAAGAAQWQRHLASQVTRAVWDTLSLDGAAADRCLFVFATSYGHLLDEPGSDTMSSWAQDCLRDLGLDGEAIVVGSGCSSGADAVGLAAAMLDAGKADVAVVVAVDIVTPAKRIAHSTLGTMAVGEVKPFDVRRSGMLLGEAAAAVALMRREDCPKHEGELLGIGAANDAYGLTAPDPSGLSVRLALDRALNAADLGEEDLSLYLAHGTGTQLNDGLEAKVVEEAFAGNCGMIVVGTKGALGHSLGACGLVEFILLLQMLKRGEAPPTVGLAEPIEGVAKRVAQPEGRPLQGQLGVSVTLGFGGFNTALVARA